MADVMIPCPDCGEKNSFSEFVAPEARCCRGCARVLELPKLEADPIRLSVRKAPPMVPPPPLSPIRGTDNGPPTEINAILKAKREQSAGREKTMRRPKRWLGPLIFLLTAGLLAGLQYAGTTTDRVQDIYLQARYGFLALAAVLVLFEAFRDSVMQGMLCLLLPFYLAYYAITRMESYVRAGFVLGVGAALGTEMLWVGDQAILHIVSREVNWFIEYVNSLISGAQAPLRP
jgi:hypothetical protein